MRRPLLIAVALAVAVLAAAGTAGAATDRLAAETELRITVWPSGKQRASKPKRWTLRCEPPGGSLPRAARACERLLALHRPFRAVPRDRACTEIYGGPQVAEVRGLLRGRPVSSKFTRTDGCQISRWQRVRFLFLL